jgi:uncharacterized protein YlxW (UPF0749 family)
VKKLIYILVALSLNSCSDIIGQKQDDEFKKDQELILMMNQFSKTSAKNEVAQSKADDKTSEIVSKAVETITTLKEENNQLKKELNEIKKKLDDISNVDSNSRFNLRPISDSQKDR